MLISVIIPTHNPRRDYLERVLAALGAQTLPKAHWELIVIDNASQPAVAPELAQLGHSSGRVVREERLGLTAARLAGFAASSGEMVVLVDDDNVLDPDYLEQLTHISKAFPHLGTWSGRLTLSYEDKNLAPPRELAKFLTLREFEGDLWSNDPNHHASTPWGAGMCIRRSVCDAYRNRVAAQPARARLDLHGDTLVYGGDTDIAYTGCAIGLGKGIFARLHITHLIPNRRCDPAFLLRSVEGQGYSEILHGWLTDGVVRNPRRDFLGRLGELMRWFFLSRVERSIAAAHRRGQCRAFRELTKEQPRATP